MVPPGRQKASATVKIKTGKKYGNPGDRKHGSDGQDHSIYYFVAVGLEGGRGEK